MRTLRLSARTTLIVYSVVLLIVATILTAGAVAYSKCNDAATDEQTAEATEAPASTQSAFVIVERGTSWFVAYHSETRVMYVVSNGIGNCGTFTLLVNADGSPMIYGGDALG